MAPHIARDRAGAVAPAIPAPVSGPRGTVDGGMSAFALAYRARGAVAMLTIRGPVDSHDVNELARTVSRVLADGPRMVVIDLFAVPAMNPQIPSELGAALRNAVTGGARLAIITHDHRLRGALELSGIAGLELPVTVNDALTIAEGP